MEEINWNNFKAKFNGKEQKSFETLCYLLFCAEFNQYKGIFRYKNQTGSETEPIESNGEVISWQAKFLETKISTQKEELKKSIDATKRKNPSVNKILFYVNKEFSESSKKEKKYPAYKIEIEDHAKSKGVKIEWRVPSHFERQLALDKNKALAQHFFSLDKSVIDFITELNQHTESILTPIHSKIEFNGNEIKIDRSINLKNLKTALEKSLLVILSGEGGTGKTALIKDFYDQIKELIPFFIFKASEFNLSNINDLFKNYGSFTLSDFINEHQNIDEKYIVIDSAEKLSDMENQEVFQQFLSSLLKNKWMIIFTTRHSYLDDLKWQFIEFYRCAFDVVNIENITKKELCLFSSKYNFNLPQNERFLELLLNPFYLNEYLQNDRTLNETETYSDFKNLLWNKKILNSSYRKNNIHLEREKCFLKIAETRANSSRFYVTVDSCNNEALISLESDEIIKHDSDNNGYFITHDIYEEWALDKIIERSFNTAEDYKYFFDSLGSSLSIRRAFRNWLSEQLLINQSEVKSLIEESIINNQIESFWKDEILVSVLLSDYSRIFFQIFEQKLLEDNQKLIMRIIFLLRIACRKIDESFLHLLGLQKTDGIASNPVFTIPKGKGWHFTIGFIHKHKEKFGLQNINIILSMLDDWNNKNKEGETTQKASQIGLYYYEEIFTKGGFRYNSRDEKKEQLIRVILQGSHEIKNELTCIFNEVVSGKKTNHRDKYHEIVQTILTSITDSFEVVRSLPDYAIKLADLFWFQIPKKDNGYSRMDVENYFCLSDNYEFNYFPASAFQTPIFQLLRFSPKATMDFILSFTNKTVECYVKSELRNEVEEVEVFINETETIKQYISDRLWNAYRGTQASTHLLESIHMALEKWLLEYSKTTSQTELENLCIYLVKNSKSASITAVVSSVILAQPSKLFNVAKILFHTKEFFLYDKQRMNFDQNAKSSYSIGYGLKNKIYQDERIKTCDDEHRKISLEHIALNYQFVKSKVNDDFEKQREILWGIWDEYYKKLPPESKQSKEDKTWRLFLARMDIRKMTPKAELEKNRDNIIITLNPEIDPKLKEYSEGFMQNFNDKTKYISLKLWSKSRFKREEDKYEQYQKYDNNPQLVISETQEIIDGLKKGVEDKFSLFNRSIPAYACAIIIRDFFDKLTENEKEFCKEVIIEFATIPLRIGRYSYQISDGTEPAIIILPQLIKYFYKDRSDIKLLIFLLLLNPQREISAFAIRGVFHNLWNINFEDAQSIFLGYLLLEPKYDDLRKKNYKKNIFEISEEELLKTFIKQHEVDLNKMVSCKITYKDVEELKPLSLEVLITAFELLPLRINNENHKTFIKNIIPIFSKKLLIDDDKIDCTLKQRFLKKFAYFVLTSTQKDIETYLKPFVDNFSYSKYMADFFQEFISAEDRLNQYEEFWIVWDIFYKQVVEICRKGSSHIDAKKIVYNYLLAHPYWKENVKEWHYLKEREKIFFNKVAQDMGNYPSVLYSLSKILNDIGSNFLEEGIFWISGIIQRNKNLFSENLEINTVFYIENIVRRYIFTNRQKIKTTYKIKNDIIAILNFLIERDSITGYLEREDIL